MACSQSSFIVIFSSDFLDRRAMKALMIFFFVFSILKSIENHPDDLEK